MSTVTYQTVWGLLFEDKGQNSLFLLEGRKQTALDDGQTTKKWILNDAVYSILQSIPKYIHKAWSVIKMMTK